MGIKSSDIFEVILELYGDIRKESGSTTEAVFSILWLFQMLLKYAFIRLILRRPVKVMDRKSGELYMVLESFENGPTYEKVIEDESKVKMWHLKIKSLSKKEEIVLLLD